MNKTPAPTPAAPTPAAPTPAAPTPAAPTPAAPTPAASHPATYAGIDVSKDHLDVCCFSADSQRRTHRFKNTSAGHRKLIGWLGTSVRVVVESTGRYGLDVTLMLHAAEGVEVMVANPKALRGYAKAQMRRTKTDAVDAEVIADYARRMPFCAWEPPAKEIAELQAITRRIQALTARTDPREEPPALDLKQRFSFSRRRERHRSEYPSPRASHC